MPAIQHLKFLKVHLKFFKSEEGGTRQVCQIELNILKVSDIHKVVKLNIPPKWLKSQFNWLCVVMKVSFFPWLLELKPGRNHYFTVSSWGADIQSTCGQFPDFSFSGEIQRICLLCSFVLHGFVSIQSLSHIWSAMTHIGSSTQGWTQESLSFLPHWPLHEVPDCLSIHKYLLHENNVMLL